MIILIQVAFECTFIKANSQPKSSRVVIFWGGYLVTFVQVRLCYKFCTGKPRSIGKTILHPYFKLIHKMKGGFSSRQALWGKEHFLHLKLLWHKIFLNCLIFSIFTFFVMDNRCFLCYWQYMLAYKSARIYKSNLRLKIM